MNITDLFRNNIFDNTIKKLIYDNEFLKTDREFQKALDGILIDGLDFYDEFGGLLFGIKKLADENICGNLLEKFWNLSGKSVHGFYGNLSYYNEFFNEGEVKNNLLLDSPVPLIRVEFIELFGSYNKIKDNKELCNIFYEDFVSRYNAEVLKEGKELPLIYPKKASESNEDNVSLDKLYYGKLTFDSTGENFDENYSYYSWYESSDKILEINDKKCLILKEIPSGGLIAVSENGIVSSLHKENSSNYFTVVNNDMVNILNASNLNTLVRDSLNRNINIPEVDRLGFYMIAKKDVKVSDLKDLEKIVKPIYEAINDDLENLKKRRR